MHKIATKRNEGKALIIRPYPRNLFIFSFYHLFFYCCLSRSSYPLILRAYRNIGKPYTMAWQIPLLLYLFLFV